MTQKQIEMSVFKNFVRLSKLDIDCMSITQPDPPRAKSVPDIFCKIKGEGPVAFELTELVDQEWKHKINPDLKDEKGGIYFEWVGNPELRLGYALREKYTKEREEMSHPVDLILYVDAYPSWTIEEIKQNLHKYLDYIKCHGKFHPDIERKRFPDVKFFYYGEDRRLVYQVRTDQYSTTSVIDVSLEERRRWKKKSMGREYIDKAYKKFKKAERDGCPLIELVRSGCDGFAPGYYLEDDLPGKTDERTKKPKKDQFRFVWLIDIQKEYCEQIG